MARQLKNAEITHVSYVDSPANKKRFLLTKSLDGGEPTFDKKVDVIIDKSDEKQLVYGVVYEPNVEDAHGDYMTSDDIEKSAHDFMREARNIDTNHDFEAGVGEVVESYIAPADFEIGGETITKGTWVMVTKASDEVWQDIKKGNITGYSMAGTAEVIEKNVSAPAASSSVISDEDGVVDRISKKIGEMLTKGVVRDYYERNKKRRNIFSAFDALSESFYDNYNTDMEQVKADANEFVELINEISYEELQKSKQEYDELKKSEEEEGEMKEETIRQLIKEELGGLKDELQSVSKGANTDDGQKASEGSEDLETLIKSVIKEEVGPIKSEIEKIKNNTMKSRQEDDEEIAKKQDDSVFGSLFMGGQ